MAITNPALTVIAVKDLLADLLYVLYAKYAVKDNIKSTSKIAIF
jgi:hypothetical protein